MELLIRATTGIFAGVCMGQSLLKMLPPRPKRWRRISIYVLLEVAITLPSWVGDENPILFFPFFMLGFLLLLSGDKLPKLIVGGIFYALLIPINMLVDSQYWGDTMQLVTIACKALVWCVLSWFLLRMIPEDGLRLSKRLWLLLGGLTLAPLMAMMSFSIWGNTFQSDEEYQFYFATLRRFGLTILPFVMVSALTLLIAAVVLSRHEALEQQSRLAALREVYYTGLKQEQTGLSILRHDLRNHVTALQGLLQEGKHAEMESYLTELSDSRALDSGRRYAKNETANVVLSSKAAQMAETGLIADFQVDLPETLSIPAPELCALLGNALDNAIEGASEANNKTVTLRAQLDKGVFMLQVKNAVGSAVNPDLSTTKSDVSRHGFGLAGMREIATRHGGSLAAAVKDGDFELVVCFPCVK